MAIAPSIFISATSTDLHSARDVVAKILTSMGYTPVWQDIAATDAGNLTQVLESWIKPCAAVIQLVGFRYGAEPRQPTSEFGRVSYTQLEALFAERIGKKVIYIFLPEGFPTDPCDPEPKEKADLQLAYRQRLKESGVLRHNAGSPLELENRVLRIRDDLATLRAEMEKSRRRLRTAMVVAVLILIAIAAGVWRLTRASERQGELIQGAQEKQRQSREQQQKGTDQILAKLEEIRSLPANIRADRLGTALAAANADELFLLRQAGVTSNEVQNALTRKFEGSTEYVARLFFDSSRDNARAIEWLKTVLKDGLIRTSLFLTHILSAEQFCFML